MASMLVDAVSGAHAAGPQSAVGGAGGGVFTRNELCALLRRLLSQLHMLPSTELPPLLYQLLLLSYKVAPHFKLFSKIIQA